MGNVLNTAYKVVADVIESEENINIEQGTLHVIDDKLKVHLEGEIKEVSTKSYKVYTALLTQSGTDAPVATVLENTLGDIVWSREGEGIYKATSANFIDNKTMSFISGITDDYSEGILNTGYVNSYGILFTCKEITTATLFDLSGASYSSGSILIEIRVYN